LCSFGSIALGACAMYCPSLAHDLRNLLFTHAGINRRIPIDRLSRMARHNPPFEEASHGGCLSAKMWERLLQRSVAYRGWTCSSRPCLGGLVGRYVAVRGAPRHNRIAIVLFLMSQCLSRSDGALRSLHCADLARWGQMEVQAIEKPPVSFPRQ